ncbi:MAG: cell division protein ZapE [Xanthomonadales bacterium]|nr:cell division protein ZapE [Xanthomonadales bacterium]
MNHYRSLVDQGKITADPGQRAVAQSLDDLWRDLQRQRQSRLLHKVRRKRQPYQHGLYIWGSVGRGKTWLMDLFFESLPVEKKQRIHFHRFMQRVHKSLRLEGNVRDPLPRIAAAWARRCKVLCLDEFFVSDIADAMLLGGLLEHLFRNGVTLVTTSNVPPDGLYKGGLQRAKFLPAIELINQNTKVIELTGDTDHRFRILQQSEIFHCPLDEDADRVMTECFNRMSAECELDHDLDINGRNFHAQRRGDGIIWFEFEELCQKPRGGVDFIEIARAFNTVVLSNVPQMGEEDSDAVRRFITLVDEFYDRNVKLLISAGAPARKLYSGRRLEFEFQRTASRLTEMQSIDYLARPHLP